MTRFGDSHEVYAMKKYAAPLTLGLACIAYGLVVVCMFYFAAQAQGATNDCNTDCLMERIEALNQKSEALKHSVGELTLQLGGCLTYVGPSGDRGGYVSWNADCSRGTSWTIN